MGFNGKDENLYNDLLSKNSILKINANNEGDMIGYSSEKSSIQYYESNDINAIYESFLKSANSDLIFRGESDVYDAPNASVHRFDDINFSQMISEYSSEVNADLLPIEEKNFLLYAQHHGLPTPLLDITEILNSALYFACNEDGNQNTNFGVLHIFESNFCIDISSIIENRKWDINIINEYNKFLKNDYSEFFSILINKLFSNNYIRTVIDQLSHDLIEYINENVLKNESAFTTSRNKESFNQYETYLNEIKIFIKKVNQNKIGDILYSGDFDLLLIKYSKQIDVLGISKDTNELSSDIMKNLLRNDPVLLYLCLLDIALFYLSSNLFIENESKIPQSLPPLPYFLIKPSSKFGRIRAQGGIFFYQISGEIPIAYNTVGMGVSIKNKKITQKIISNRRILITDKKKILKQLEYLGINRGTIYLDPDNIAKHIRNKFSWD